MAYVKKHWEDQDVERQKTYEFEKNDDGSTKLIESFGEVKNLGTPVNAENMNRIEEGIAGCGIRKYNHEEKFELGEWVLGVLDGKKIIFESLKDENKGNNLENSEFWAAVDFNNSGGSNLFDLIQKDHILAFEEKEGLERLGEFVYKEAQDGRYGYPDFYEKCIDEFKDENNTKENLYISSNVETIAEVTDKEGILSNFSTNNYASINKTFELESAQKNWEIVLKIKTPSSVSSSLAIFGSGASVQKYGIVLNFLQTRTLAFYVSGNSTSWNIANSITSTNTLELEKEYLIKISYKYKSINEEDSTNIAKAIYSVDVSNISESISKDEWVNYITKEIDITSQTQEDTYKAASFTPSLGLDFNRPFTNGEINLNQSYIEIGDEIFWQGVKSVEITKNLNGHRFYDIKDKEKVDKIYQDTGVAWYYGIDTAQERILLPRNDYFFQNNKNAGKYIEAGLPDHDHKVTDAYTWASIQVAGGSASVANNKSEISTTLASQSNPIYGANKTVQPPSVGVIVYMVVGNTSTKKARSEAIELTSSTNDTLPMFTPIYFDFKPNHPSWIKAGSTLKADIYESAYSELLKIVNGEETKYGEGLKVVKESGKLSDTDYSEYWIVNEDEQTFRAPLKLSFSPVSSGKVPVIGNGKSLTFSNGTTEYPIAIGNYNGNAVIVPWHDTSLLGQDIGQVISGANSLPTNNLAGLTTNPDLSGIVADLSGLKSDKAQLYFKVANALENIEAIDCGEVLEELNNKISKTECKAYVKETYTNGTSGYRIWSDGYCEQWGRLTTNSDTVYTVNLLKEMKDTNYLCANSRGVTGSYRSGVFGAHTNEPFNFKTTSFDVYGYSIDGINTIQWEVKGYIKEGE